MHNRSNGRTAMILAVAAFGMMGVAYASVPLYRIFCQVTGFGGTTQIAEALEDRPILERMIKVRFSANTHRDMPWKFRPAQTVQALNVGEQALAFYEVVNPTEKSITGTATFNVTPFKVGPYFVKIDCFCFTEQTLQPGQRADMPVTFYIDPAIADDPGLDDVTEIVLSYTFFTVEEDVHAKSVAD